MGPEKDDNVGERNQRKVGNDVNEKTEVIRYMCEQQRLFQPRPGIRRGQTIPERRGLDAVNLEPFRYEVGTIPAEWEAWLRKKRKDPPTIEEILKNEKYRGEMQLKIKDVSEKDKLLQAKEYKEGLVAEPVSTQIKGHASAHYYGKNQPSQDPTSIANTFQPGSWMPPDGSSHNK
ncbi:NADH dehydrogenase [ubiquinone] 1 alpha subcomplex assembly factor 2 [Alligator sinensis]|uniref:NADH dehydrogenase [ubiquinone] 1 alpha subcomplex assembly factor 2 n=1 Tax=Alligator sinensis TaxID=38654 RepID=A0A3Q0GNQ4_ALLSI|nr:NADH dehydrogenase [ubiquinone] 1 alpha subcomplex assembly factor 2 [Alligator sinensis]